MAARHFLRGVAALLLVGAVVGFPIPLHTLQEQVRLVNHVFGYRVQRRIDYSISTDKIEEYSRSTDKIVDCSCSTDKFAEYWRSTAIL